MRLARRAAQESADAMRRSRVGKSSREGTIQDRETQMHP
jgi:hypothetical protein